MIRWPKPEELIGDVSDHQRAAAGIALSGRVGILTGGPGVGKSFVLASIVQALLNKGVPAWKIGLCAPTGKAAVRIGEMLAAKKIEAGAATTMHRLLEPGRNGHDGDGWGFKRRAEFPLEEEFIIGDEQSMVDCPLMASLFSACKPGTHILLVGDLEQLPPVGPGRPFADMIAAGVPCGRLTEIHRFAGRIATVCHKISAGESWHPSPKLDTECVPPENMRHYETRDSAQQDQLLNVINLLREKRGYDPFNCVQVLLATNKFRERINKVLQDALNPNGEQVDGCKFRMGDKAICLRNQFVEIYTGKANPPKRYTANGEIGRVVHVASDGMRVEFPDGDVIQVSRGGQADYDLAYAVTVWKAQGSQWPVAILLPEDNYGADLICDRAFWRTGISRASELTFTIGKRAVIDRQCRVASLHTRKTLLTEKILAIQSARGCSIQGAV